LLVGVVAYFAYALLGCILAAMLGMNNSSFSERSADV